VELKLFGQHYKYPKAVIEKLQGCIIIYAVIKASEPYITLQPLSLQQSHNSMVVHCHVHFHKYRKKITYPI